MILVLAFCLMAGAQKPVIEKWKVEDLQAAIRNAESPTIFNFWATFCKPCIEEIPWFEQLVKKYENDGVKLVLVSLDFAESYPKKIADFAAKRKFTAPITFLDETNADVFCPAVDESWSGVLPATLFVNNATKYRSFHEEQIKKDKLEEEIRKLIRKGE
ncbi:MAG: TlpA disulfide reductase family protein [Flavisolibacter sp.]